MKKVIAIFIVVATLTGCNGNDNTVQTYIVSNTSYDSQDELESATQTDTLTVDEPIYTSIHFVESPKGMEYTVKWYLDGTEIKTETKATVNDTQDVVAYELDGEQAVEGTLKIEIIYKDTTLLTYKKRCKFVLIVCPTNIKLFFF